MHRLFELSGTKLIAWSPPVPLAAVRHFKLPACSRAWHFKLPACSRAWHFKLPACSRACFRALECRRWPLMATDGH